MTTPAAELAAQAVAKRAQAYELRQAGRVTEAEGLEASATILERSAERMARQESPKLGDVGSKLVDSRPGEGVRFAASNDCGMTTGVVPGAPAAAGPGIPEFCSDRERHIVEIIRQHHRAEPINAQVLAAQLHCTPRDARGEVAHLRADHAMPILSVTSSEHGGYYWPERPEEGEAALAQLESRRVEIEAAARGIREGLARVFGTMPLPFGRAA